MIGRVLAALALFGPPLIGIVAPALSLLAFRKRRRPSTIAVVVILVVWLLLCVGTSKVLMSVAFGFTWGWAHAERAPLLGEELTFLGYVVGGLILLSAAAFALHRLLIVWTKAKVEPYYSQ